MRRIDLKGRSSGVLLHPTSLPGPHGSGDLGSAAYRFADFLAEAGQRWWQMLPVCPIGAGNSPYQTFSSFAGNPLLIDLGELAKRGLLETQQTAPDHGLGEPATIRYAAMIPLREALLKKAFTKFEKRRDAKEYADFSSYCEAHRDWLEDYALFCALKSAHNGAAWTDWDEGLRQRRPEALAAAKRKLRRRMRYYQFLQFEFHAQWSRLRSYCAGKGIGLIGDVPIFVGHDSVDVWAHQEFFWLDEAGRPAVLAGVPPDYFSKTGQLWGNALYRWDVLRETGYHWWVRRLKTLLERFDVLRLDHFIGFSRYWEIPAGAKTAEHGRWMPAPGHDFFEKIGKALECLPFIAEDLGLITEEVKGLRDRFSLPGMRILQFAFAGGGDANENLPHHYPPCSVVYTGTHDNDTTAGWFAKASAHEREAAMRYMNTDGHEIHWDMIRAALASRADTAIVPMQDLLGLGSEARMNTPGTLEGNWLWRLHDKDVHRRDIAERLRRLTETSGRQSSSISG